MPADRPSLAASVLGGLPTGLRGLFDQTEAADDFAPLPKGVYRALAVDGRLTESKKGTPGYSVAFRVSEGEYAGRRLWRTFYLSEAAIPYTKRDLAKLGITTEAQLVQPFPADRMLVRLTVVLRKDDDGTERNEVTGLEFLELVEPTTDPFAPVEPAGDGSATAPETEQ